MSKEELLLLVSNLREELIQKDEKIYIQTLNINSWKCDVARLKIDLKVLQKKHDALNSGFFKAEPRIVELNRKIKTLTEAVSSLRIERESWSDKHMLDLIEDLQNQCDIMTLKNRLLTITIDSLNSKLRQCQCNFEILNT